MRRIFLICIACSFPIIGKAQTFINFTIVQNLPLIADAGSGTLLCNGGTANLSGLVFGGDGSYTYQWTPSASVSSPTNIVTSGTPSATTVYTLTITDGNQCTNMDTVVITLASTPLGADAGTNVAICAGDNAALMAAGSGGYGSYTYLWSPGSTLSDSTIFNPISTTTITTTYTVTVTDANFCTLTDMVTITLPSVPLSVDAGTGGTICSGNIFSLNASAAGGYGSFVYDWSPGSSLNDSTIANPNASPTNDVTYVLQVTDANGCTLNDAVNLTVVDCSGLENNQTELFTIYPNPSNGTFNLLLQEIQIGSNVKIYTPTGSLIYTSKLTEEINHLIQLTNVAEGIYLLVLENTNGSIHTQKLVIR